MTDFTVRDEGTIVLLNVETERAERWIGEHVDAEATRWGRGIVVEHRFIRDILEGAIRDGLTVAAEGG